MRLVEAIMELARTDAKWEQFRQEAVDLMRSGSGPALFSADMDPEEERTPPGEITPWVVVRFTESDDHDDIAAASLASCLYVSPEGERLRWKKRFIWRFTEEARRGRCRVSGIVDGVNEREIPARVFGDKRFVSALITASREFEFNELTLPDGKKVMAVEVEFPTRVERVTPAAQEKEKPGPKAKKQNRLIERMLGEIDSGEISPDSLRTMKQTELEARYGPHSTADRARKEVLKILKNS